jgi:limonene-1,2-epoxide hydrolase
VDVSQFRRAVEARDLDSLIACLAPDVVFHSPVTFKPYQGREAVRQLLGVIMETFEDFAYTDELAGDSSHILVFRTRVGDRDIEGLDLLRFGQDGLIHDFTVMVRPMSAVIALAQAVGPKLEALEA